MSESEQRLEDLEAVLRTFAGQVTEATEYLASLTPEQRIKYAHKVREIDDNIRAIYKQMQQVVPEIMREELGKIGDLMFHQANSIEAN